MPRNDKEQLFDCMITCGERVLSGMATTRKTPSSEKWSSAMSLNKNLKTGMAQLSA